MTAARPHPARRPRRGDPGHRRRPGGPRAGAAAAPGAGGGRARRARPGRGGLRALGAQPRRAQARPVGALRRRRRDGVRDLGAGQERHVDVARRQRRPVRLDARLRDPAGLRRPGRHLLRAVRGRQHRPRGHDADGRVLRDLGDGLERPLGDRPARGDGRRRRNRAGARRLRDPPAGRSDRDGHGHQLPRGGDHGLLVHRHLRLERHARLDRFGAERPPARHRSRSRASAASSARST